MSINNENKSSLKGSCLWGILLFGILLLVDMLTKIAAELYFIVDIDNGVLREEIDIIPGWISLCLTSNRGIAYGMGKTAPTWAKIAVIIGTGVVMAVFAVFYFKLDKSRVLARIALVFIVAGGVGNLIDRIYYQVWDPSTVNIYGIADGVRDMVNLTNLGFAVCNFADFFITGGAVALVLALVFFDKDAIFPVGKYKRLSEEEEQSKEKTEEKNG